MAYVRCSNDKCGWSQDDWWSEDYNPAKSALGYTTDLLSADLDRVIPADGPNYPAHTVREGLAQAFERLADQIRGMHYRTKAEAKAAGWKCPRCSAGLIED